MLSDNFGPELERDDNGKLRCLPFQIPAEYRAKKSPAVRKSTVEKKRNFKLPLERLILDPADLEDGVKKSPATRKSTIEKKRNIKLPLERLILNPADLEDSPKQPAKVRKVEAKSVRKELFKVPQRVAPTRSQRQTLSRQSLTGSKKLARGRYQQGVTPLLDITEETAEFSMTTNTKVTTGYPFKSPSNPIINFSKQKKETVNFQSLPKESAKSIPDKRHISPDLEFLQLEKSCATPKRNLSSFSSPSSAICNLMRKTSLSDIETVSDSNKKTDETKTLSLGLVINTVRNIITDHEKDFQMLTQRHEDRMSQLKSLLKSLEDCESQNKENTTTRRSGRLAARNSMNGNENTNSVKISVPVSNSALLTSPAISRSVDLRKATLNNNLARNIKTESVTPRGNKATSNNNLARNIKTEIVTPRGNKATEMYNSMRSEFPFLCTPKLSINTPKNQTGRRAISKTLQEQLLLLQQTPSHI